MRRERYRIQAELAIPDVPLPLHGGRVWAQSWKADKQQEKLAGQEEVCKKKITEKATAKNTLF